jgi:hypothetical protein
VIRENFQTGDNMDLSSSDGESNAAAPSAMAISPTESSYARSSEGSAGAEVHQDRHKRETASASLGHNFLSAVAGLGRAGEEEDEAAKTARFSLEFTDVEERFDVTLGGGNRLHYISESDGCLLRHRLVSGEWARVDDAVYCSVEAKAGYWHWSGDDDVARGHISLDTFAQVVSQMVGMVMRRYEDVGDYNLLSLFGRT